MQFSPHECRVAQQHDTRYKNEGQGIYWLADTHTKYTFRNTAVRIDYLLVHRKQILLVNFRPGIYFIGSNDLSNLKRLLVSFNSVVI